MIIDSVHLHNIRSYLDERVVFPQGSVLLSGDIGSGKSSILLAIEFALFGLKRKDLGGAALLRNGKSEGFVELKFFVGKKEIIIKRVLKRQRDNIVQSSGYIIIDGSKKDLTPVELKDFVLDLLGYPKEFLTKKDMIYRYTVYTPQEEMKQILLDEPENRLDLLRKIFGIDKYKRVRENTGLLLRELREKKSNFDGQISDLAAKLVVKDRLDEELVVVGKRLSVAEDSLDKLKSETGHKKLKLMEFEVKLQNFNNMKKDLVHLGKVFDDKFVRKEKFSVDLKALDAQLKSLEHKISSVKIVPVPLKSEEEIEKELREKEEKFNSITKELEVSKEKLRGVKEKVSFLKKQFEDKSIKSKDLILKKALIDSLSDEVKSFSSVDRQIDENLSLIARISGDINTRKVLINNSKVLIEKLSKLDNCPTCLQGVDKFHKSRISDEEHLKIKKHSFEIDELVSVKDLKETLLKEQKLFHVEFLKKQRSLDVLKSEVRKLDDEVKDLVDLQKSFNHLLELEDSLLKKVSVLESVDTSSLSKSVANFRKLLSIVRNNKSKEHELKLLNDLLKERLFQRQRLVDDLDSLSGQIVVLEKERVGLFSGLKELDGVVENYDSLVVVVEDFIGKERASEVFVEKLRTEVDGLRKNLSVLAKEVGDKQLLKDRIYGISQLQNWLDSYFISLMSVMEKHVMFSVYSQFDSLFRDWFSQLVSEESLTCRLDESFTPVIEQNGYETSVENLSGGERTSAALAYRLSLNKVVNNVVSTIKTKDIIILDEPTDGFSSEQLDKVRDVVEQLGVKQVIIVSHESKIESFVDNVVKIAKNEHISSVI